MKMQNYYLVDAFYYKKICVNLKKTSSHDSKEKFRLLSELCAYNRINTLTAIYKAAHGWLGASLSIAEIITNLYFDIADIHSPTSSVRDFILLSKGHAAVMQYAALVGKGFIKTEDLLKYKHPEGPQAHTDIKTKGIEINSGSLGQTLSKACGIAYNAKNKIYVILGDGELQEGQNFEALMTIAKFNLCNVIPIIDKNNIQSDSNVEDIKQIKNLNMVLAGFGFNVIEGNGNSIEETNKILTLLKNTDIPAVFIANTSKGAGISFMSSSSAERRGYSWHSGIPSPEEYLSALSELKADIKNPKIISGINNFCDLYLKKSGGATNKETKKKNSIFSTGQAFSGAIAKIATDNKNIFVLDADLEKSCKLTEFAQKFPDRFIEIGISEQDMVSFAGGLALKGKIPAVNTYANFYRRAFEQVYINSTEEKKIIYAGHYSGLCYSTDGKSHQATGDTAMMRSIPNMLVFHPAFPEELILILKWYISSNIPKPIYFKLHRTPPESSVIPDKNITFKYGYGIKIREYSTANACILTSGPHLTFFCAEAVDTFNAFKNKKTFFDLFSISTLKNISPAFFNTLAKKYESLIVIEENINAGGLFDELNLLLSQNILTVSRKKSNFKLKSILHKAPVDFTFSTLKQFGLYKKFGLDKSSIVKYLNAVTD